MKTNKFEDTIRRKLESIEPDFQEKDWAKMQNYMHAQSPPSFWQQHSSWIGYAAAASVSTVMAFMYVNQRTQNNHLTADVKKLQHQIEAIKNTPTLAQKPDTVYLIQKSDGSGELMALSEDVTPPGIAPNESIARRKIIVSEKITRSAPPKTTVAPTPTKAFSTNDQLAENADQPVLNTVVPSANSFQANGRGGSGIVINSSNYSQNNAGAERFAMPADIELNLQRPVDVKNSNFGVNKMKYNLASRISKRHYQQAMLASTMQKPILPVSEKKTEQVAQTETVIPKRNLKVPYRFGVGIATDGVGKTKSITGEVLIAKKFSISAGISWLKVKPMEFFNEKLFREKNRRDFKGTHPGEIPLAFQVYNIKVDPTVVQIPLTVAFRNNIKDNWAYYAGAGTNITVSAKEKISFDCKAPNFEYFSQRFEAKSDVPMINSVNFTMGLEKTWYPIVVQAEGYLYTYFNQLTPMSQSAGPGVKVKLMYQIGGKM
ncbi:hypothetical protein [Dyadobacter psychrophilus]|uniref:Outer membrane protein beta-barrel domain-containing protein n=1 Tax=Dyadobacter psychrophilus TaxID=651661 RepID=A0A1T5FGM9_9BACT|nr:hypothetical protein [Dyadobacter psychrophilus]SKB95309.1 hypothetical protein SAMN05660293_03189 [Dyadobacter psychrophilus]